MRKLLLEEGRLGRYFTYALGEIILVVIGILIALHVNNKNLEYKLKQEEIAILQSLLTDLKSAQNQSQRGIDNEDYALFVLNTLLKEKTERDDLLQEYNLDAVLYQAFWNFEVDVPVINTYSYIKSTGKQDHISNMEIRKRFNAIDMGINNLSFLIEDRAEVQQRRIDPVVIEQLNFVRLLKTDNPSLEMNLGDTNQFDLIVDNPIHRNMVAAKLELTQSVKNFRVQLARDIDMLVEMIEQELGDES
ncbi:hypothetical protein [Glaciecola sp. 1036]|uniref:hypothetical protein n=1 Tax=Alteromonadaceae TaxID=72275 RepID=UPI003D064E97